MGQADGSFSTGWPFFLFCMTHTFSIQDLYSKGLAMWAYGLDVSFSRYHLTVSLSGYKLRKYVENCINISCSAYFYMTLS